MGKKRRPLPNGHHALRREAEEAARPDRLFPIRSNKYYGYYAGRLAGKRQALAALDVRKNLVLAVFDQQGDLLEVKRRTPAPSLKRRPEKKYLAVNDREFHEYLHKEFRFKAGRIKVNAFLIAAEGLAVHAFPYHYQEFLKNPYGKIFDNADRDYYPKLIREWIADKAFVLDWGNDYWLDNNGEVTSS
jgi:hypothetical protein